jgi:PHS family inorganic phosphate transporter-like MFS transporter
MYHSNSQSDFNELSEVQMQEMLESEYKTGKITENNSQPLSDTPGKGIRHVKSGILISALGSSGRGRSDSLISRKSSGEHDEETTFLGDDDRGDQSEVVLVKSNMARVFLAGAGFLSDAYDLFVINQVLPLLRSEYPELNQGDGIAEGLVASSALIGSVLGQICAGSMADVYGRKIIFILTAFLIIVGSIGAACAQNWPSFNVYHQLAFWRFILGAGVGGEYPLAATVTSESSSAAKRGTLMASVFAMQGLGSCLSALVVVVLLYFGVSYAITWRVALAFGALPAAVAFPWRLRMHETETFQKVRNDRSEASILNESGSSRVTELLRALKYYKFHILGTASAWLLLDVVYYANGLFNHDVTNLVLATRDENASALTGAWHSGIIAVLAAPGYLLAVKYLEIIGRKRLQMLGFLAMALLYGICSISYASAVEFLQTESDPQRTLWCKVAFMTLYALTFLTSNFGPNTTTFLIPGEIFPAEVRGTAHGLSAASGKAGAALGAYFFPILMRTRGGGGGPTLCFQVCSGLSLLGALVTYLFTPKYGSQELEDEYDYIQLEHECLRPTIEQQSLLSATKLSDRLKSFSDLAELASAAGNPFVDISSASSLKSRSVRTKRDMYGSTEQN